MTADRHGVSRTYENILELVTGIVIQPCQYTETTELCTSTYWLYGIWIISPKQYLQKSFYIAYRVYEVLSTFLSSNKADLIAASEIWFFPWRHFLFWKYFARRDWWRETILFFNLGNSISYINSLNSFQNWAFHYLAHHSFLIFFERHVGDSRYSTFFWEISID